MSRTQFVLLATLFQSGLLILGWGIATIFGISLRYEWSGSDILKGTLGTLPMLLFLWWALTSNWKPLRELKILLTEQLGPLLLPCSFVDLFYISCLAGISEEVLFRGALQNSMAGFGLIIAVGATNILFGICHAASLTYFIYAFAAGMYLTWLAGFTPQNLVPAIVTHSLYDLVALSVIRILAKNASESADELLMTDGESPQTEENSLGTSEMLDKNVKIENPEHLESGQTSPPETSDPD